MSLHAGNVIALALPLLVHALQLDRLHPASVTATAFKTNLSAGGCDACTISGFANASSNGEYTLVSSSINGGKAFEKEDGMKLFCGEEGGPFSMCDVDASFMAYWVIHDSWQHTTWDLHDQIDLWAGGGEGNQVYADSDWQEVNGFAMTCKFEPSCVELDMLVLDNWKQMAVNSCGEPSTTATPASATSDTVACDNSTGTCTIAEDPHVEVFDGAQTSLLQAKLSSSASTVSDSEGGDQWLVKSSRVSIQARLAPDDSLPDRNLFVRALAVGGEFLKGNTLVVGSLEGAITWNGVGILSGETSEFHVIEDGYFIKARRGENSSLVQDPSRGNHGVDIELPSGVSLVVNRLHHHVNVAIKMPPQEEGQDGLCGNHNGVAADDSLEMVARRLDPRVPPEESLFTAWADAIL